MANIKITQLPTATTIDDNDLIAVVTGMDGTPTTEHITKFDFAASLASSPLATNPVENTYADIASIVNVLYAWLPSITSASDWDSNL